jgi:hypothetical protein
MTDIKDGKFKKGVSGNPNGRPSKAKQAETLIKKLDVNQEFDLKDAQKSLERMLAFYNVKFDEAKTPEDQIVYSKLINDTSNKLMAYQRPRISSIESADSKPTEITIGWKTPEDIPDDHPMKDI